jgi:diguanylate cyclase (GGDEF)-like protein
VLFIVLSCFAALAIALSIFVGYLLYQTKRRDQALLQAGAVEAQLRRDLVQLEEKYRPSREDQITGLPSWPVFEDRFTLVIAESERTQLMVGMLLVDIGDFVMLSEALSNQGGAVLLREVAGRIRQVLRKVDTVSRFQNATFAVMVTQLAKPETAAIVAQRMLSELAQPFYVSNREIYINASIGISIYPTDGNAMVNLMHAAQSAVKTASEGGNHIYYFYEKKNQADSQRDMLLHVDLKRETIFQELVIFYQPMIDKRTNVTMCMDTRLCWQHPALGLIDAQELNDHVEKQRKQNMFTEWLLKAACRQFVQWRDFGFCPALLGVPVSIRQLESTPFIYHLAQIMQSCEFKPEWLLLELRDTDLGLSFDVLEKAFNMLNYLGVKLAVSHVGTTSFSFSYLRQIHVQYLILEQGFIDDVETNPRTLAVIEGMQAMADTLGCDLIASGVETEAQAALLREAGCQLLQGRLVGEPVQDRDVRVKMAPQV